MKKQKLILPIVILCTIMTLMTLVLATTTITSPVEGGNYSGTVNLTVTTALSPYNCSFWYSSDGSPAITLMVAITNESEDDVALSDGTFDISEFTDAVTYNISANCTVGDTGETAEAVNVSFDNTDPSITLTKDYSKINLHRILKYSTSISDATVGLSGNEVCNITNPRGVVTDVSTSALITDAIFDDTGTVGNYTLTCYAADTAGNTDTESTSFEVKSTGPLIRAEEEVKGISGFFDVIKNIISGIAEAIGNILSGFKK